MIKISGLTIYPIKSCAGTSVQEFQLDRFGPQYDRRWMVVDGKGAQVTQREVAGMALIKPTLCEGGLRIQYGEQSLQVNIPVNGAQCEVQVWSDTVSAHDAGDPAAKWFSNILKQQVRLVWMPETTQRFAEKPFSKNNETVGFADAYPLLLISEASLEDLNSRLKTPVPMNRFRPNIVVSGCTAFAEDSWASLCIGELELSVAKPCARCVMPSIDQLTGEKDSEILRVLASFRRGEDKQTYFGQNLLYQNTGRLRIGDEAVLG